MTTIEFPLSHRKCEKTADTDIQPDSENIVLKYASLNTITDDRLALAALTTEAQRLINKGIEPATVHEALYRAGAHMACVDEAHYHRFSKMAHDQLTKHSTHHCDTRLDPNS